MLSCFFFLLSLCCRASPPLFPNFPPTSPSLSTPPPPTHPSPPSETNASSQKKKEKKEVPSVKNQTKKGGRKSLEPLSLLFFPLSRRLFSLFLSRSAFLSHFIRAPRALSSASSSSTSSTSSSIPFSRIIFPMSSLDGETRNSICSHSPVAKTRVRNSPSRAREDDDDAPECRSTELIASLVSRSRNSPASPVSTRVRSDSGRFLGRRPTARMSPLEVRTKGRPSTTRYGFPPPPPRIPPPPPGALPLPLGPKKASSSLSLKALEKPRKAPTKRREAPMALRREVGCFFLFFFEEGRKRNEREEKRKSQRERSRRENQCWPMRDSFFAAFSLLSPDSSRSRRPL